VSELRCQLSASLQLVGGEGIGRLGRQEARFVVGVLRGKPGKMVKIFHLGSGRDFCRVPMIFRELSLANGCGGRCAWENLAAELHASVIGSKGKTQA
jgi:hypothetical protein